MKQGFTKGYDDSEIYFYEWNDVEKPIGIVQIFHGMAEHAKRYENFAKFLNKLGYIVFADDHRAHGKTAKSVEEIGKYHGENLFFDTLKDEICFSKMLKEKYKLPLYVFGHSYGSFLCQAYIQNSSYYEKAIICGSALMKGRIDVKLGRLIAKITKLFKGEDAPAKLIEKITFEGYDKKLKSGSWLNTDEEAVKKYYADEMCGGRFSARFYIDFFGAFGKIYKKSAVEKIDKNKPVFIIAGGEDPVGSCGKSVLKLFNFYKKIGLENVEIKIYEGARHEILNEKINQEVYKDVEEFLKK